MSDLEELSQHLVLRSAGKPWQWLCIVVLSGLCCGVTGLYVGSAITGHNMALAMDKQRTEFETSTKNEVATHAAEFNSVNKNTVVIAQSVAALATAVGTLTDRINAVSDRVGVVAATADRHSQQIQQTQHTAKAALDRAVVADAKTTVVEAKEDATASEVKAVLPKPVAPATVPAKPESRSWLWWTEGVRH
jgi:hypothetical protein